MKFQLPLSFITKFFGTAPRDRRPLLNSELNFHRIMFGIAFVSQMLWILFAKLFVPGFEGSVYQIIAPIVAFICLVHSLIRPQMSVKTADSLKLLIGMIMIIHSYYSCWIHDLHPSELMGSLVVLIIVFQVLKTQVSVLIYALTVLAAILSFIGYPQGLIPPQLAVYLWLAVLATSSISAFNRIRNDSALAESLEFTESIISNMAEGLIVHDQNFSISKMNRAAEEILAISTEKALGKTNKDPVWETLQEDGSPMPSDEHPSYVSQTTGKKIINFPIIFASSENKTERKNLLVSSVPIFRNSAVVPSQVLVTIQDVTSLKKRELELKKNEAALVHAGKLTALGEMAGGIAHEINNPLAIISGKVGLLKKKLQQNSNLEPKFILEHLEKVESTVHRISKIINSMRSFTRIENGDNFVSHPVQNLIDETLDLCQETLAGEQIKVQVNSAQNLQIFCNPIQISQVLMNLLQNSRDAIRGQSEKWIQIEIIDQNEFVAVVCTDSGPRIPDAVANKIMQPFFTTKEIGKGTGLGLSISKGIASRHGGQLTLNRAHPHTQFILTLPKASQQIAS